MNLTIHTSTFAFHTLIFAFCMVHFEMSEILGHLLYCFFYFSEIPYQMLMIDFYLS